MMDVFDSEKVIYGPSMGKLDKTFGKIYLTNKRILVVSQGLVGYNLADISNIKLHSRMANIPKIEFSILGTKHTLEITTSSGNMFLAPGFDYADNASIASFWASLLTMSVFMFGNPINFEQTNPLVKPERLWCIICNKYVTVETENRNIHSMPCPVCGKKLLTSKKPE